MAMSGKGFVITWLHNHYVGQMWGILHVVPKQSGFNFNGTFEECNQAITMDWRDCIGINGI